MFVFVLLVYSTFVDLYPPPNTPTSARKHPPTYPANQIAAPCPVPLSDWLAVLLTFKRAYVTGDTVKIPRTAKKRNVKEMEEEEDEQNVFHRSKGRSLCNVYLH